MTDVSLGDTALGYGPRVEVPPPAYSPFRHGLFSAAPPRPFGGTHERSGVWAFVDPYEPPDGTGPGPDAFTYADGCTPAVDRTKTIPRGALASFGDPVTVYAGFSCTPAGRTDAERERLARQALLLGEERALEHLLAGGATSNGVAWTSPLASATVDATSHVAMAHTFGDLETSIVDGYGGEGVVLIPGSLFEYMSGFGMVKKDDDGSLRTPFGNRVAVNRGLGAQPLDASVPVEYCGNLVILRGEVDTLGEFKESFNFSNNDLVRVVERTYVLLTDFPPA